MMMFLPRRLTGNTTALTTLLLLVIAAAPCLHALKCKCYFGRVVQAVPTCRCACYEGYLGEKCDISVIDTVRVDVYLTQVISQFSSEVFVSRVGKEILTDKVQYIFAVPLDKWNKTNVLLGIPGYAVPRFLLAVERVTTDWVIELHIESAYVVPPVLPSTPSLSDIALDINGYRVPVKDLAWLLAAIGVVFCLLCVECTFCFSNDEDHIDELGYERPPIVKYAPGVREQQQQQQARLNKDNNGGGEDNDDDDWPKPQARSTRSPEARPKNRRDASTPREALRISES